MPTDLFLILLINFTSNRGLLISNLGWWLGTKLSMSIWHFAVRNAKSLEHATIGRGNIFRLRKEKAGNTVEFLETISLNSVNYHFFYDECYNTSLDVSEMSNTT